MIFSWIFSNNDLMKYINDALLLYYCRTCSVSSFWQQMYMLQFFKTNRRCWDAQMAFTAQSLLQNQWCPNGFFWTVTPTISFSFWDKLKHFGDRSASLNLWCWIFECFFPAAADDIGNLISTWVRLKICPAKDTSTAFLSKRTESWKTPLIGG